MADHPNIPRKSTFSGPWDPWKPIGTHRCLGWPVDPDPGAWGLQVLRRPAMAGLVKSFWSVGWGGAGRANNSRKTMCCFFWNMGTSNHWFSHWQSVILDYSGWFCGPILGNLHVVSGLEYCWQLTRNQRLLADCLLTFWLLANSVLAALG